MDKVLHFLCCFFIAVVVELICHGVFGMPQALCGCIGFIAALVVGVLKEAYDKRKGGLFDFKDLAADAMGASLAFLCCFLM